MIAARFMLWPPADTGNVRSSGEFYQLKCMSQHCSGEQGEHLDEELDPHGEEGSGDYDPDDLTHEEEDLHDVHRYVMRSASEDACCGN